MCTLPDNIGPFSWGEIGLYLDTGELFALAALPQPQNKYSSLESDIASSVTFYCYLTLAYDKVTITIDYGQDGNPASTVEILDVYSWDAVKSPSSYPLGVSQLIVHELSPYNGSTILAKNDDSDWSVASTYVPIVVNPTPVDSTAQYISYKINNSIGLSDSLASSTPNEYIAKFADGSFSSFSSVEVDSSNNTLKFVYTTPLSEPRDLESQTLIFKVAEAAVDTVSEENPINIDLDTVGSLPYSRLSGDAVIESNPPSSSNDTHIATTAFVNNRVSSISQSIPTQKSMHSYVNVGNSGTAPYDMIVVVTINSGNTLSTATVNGVVVAQQQGRDKYGVGPSSYSFPVPKGQTWSITGNVSSIKAVYIY